MLFVWGGLGEPICRISASSFRYLLSRLRFPHFSISPAMGVQGAARESGRARGSVAQWLEAGVGEVGGVVVQGLDEFDRACFALLLAGHLFAGGEEVGDDEVELCIGGGFQVAVADDFSDFGFDFLCQGGVAGGVQAVCVDGFELAGEFLADLGHRLAQGGVGGPLLAGVEREFFRLCGAVVVIVLVAVLMGALVGAGWGGGGQSEQEGGEEGGQGFGHRFFSGWGGEGLIFLHGRAN